MNDLFGQNKEYPNWIRRSKNTDTCPKKKHTLQHLQNEHQKPTGASLLLNELKLAAVTISYDELFCTCQTLLAKLNLRTSSRQFGKYNLKLCPRVRTSWNEKKSQQSMAS